MLILCVEFWPRLIVDEQKPAWLKVNFDRWQSEDLSDSEKDEQEQQEKLEVNILHLYVQTVKIQCRSVNYISPHKSKEVEDVLKEM